MENHFVENARKNRKEKFAKPIKFENSDKRICAQSSVEEDANALTTLIKNFKWETFTILVSNHYENTLILSLLKNNFSQFRLNSYIYEPEISESMMASLIKKFIKSEGVKNLLILDSGESLKQCIKLLKHMKMNQYGNYFVFGTSTIFSVDLEGAIIIDIEGTQDSKTREDYYLTIISHIIQRISD